MKIGSKLAIKKLKTITTKDGRSFYYATLVEATLNSKIKKMNKWEYSFYVAYIYTDLKLEEAIFDIELEDKMVQYYTPSGELKEFTKRPNKLDFDRISNPEKSIIRVLNFEFKTTTAQKNGETLLNDLGKPIYNNVLSINNCEFDCTNWKLPDKKLELRVETVEKQKKALVEKYRNQIKELKDKLKKYEITEDKEKIYFEINKVEFILDEVGQFTDNMNFFVDLKEYEQIKNLDNEKIVAHLFCGKYVFDSKLLKITIGSVDTDNLYPVNLSKCDE